MEEQKNNQLVVSGIILGLLSIAFGFWGYASSFLVGTYSSVYLPLGISVVASLGAIVFGWRGLLAIKESGGREKGEGMGNASIVIGVLNILLLMYLIISY